MAWLDPFDNTAPTGFTPARAAAFDNNAPVASESGWSTYTAVAGTISNTTVSGVIAGSTLDGITLATGNLVLLAKQTTVSECGLYAISAGGAAPTRAVNHARGFVVKLAAGGSSNGGKVFSYTPVANYVAGSSSATFTQVTATARSI